ncbi:hypothetical protein ACNPQK_07505 [Acinetobacter guillouiae]|jgi:hypothetical protein|uniref:Uncharacterized protein n=1 Tax=Acinetobacter guillouiae TaxID=106649 RepID=A0A8X8GHI0_ACIGI|nr:hypothetical protein [Acinetobacter guillouiae]MCF0264420.1 hypothetical protein [Acinetobacter guillouiae]
MINLSDGYEDFPIIFKTILDKGYQIWIDELGSFWAEKDGWDFVSDNPAGLLGLIAIYEAKKPEKFKERWWE